MRKIILLAVVMIMLLIPNFLFANNKIGKIISYTGKVKIYKKSSIKGQSIKNNFVNLYPYDLVKTKRKSTACIKLIDESKIVMTEKSALELLDLKDIEISKGKILFKIKTQNTIKGLTIKTKTATIGVKGTTFAVISDNKSVNVFLKQGILKIEPIEGEFKRFIKKEHNDFGYFLKQQQNEYSEYKKNFVRVC